MNNESLLSIIIPVYGKNQGLTRCLDSVLSQTYRNIEVIVINNSNDDNITPIVNYYQKNDSRIVCETSNNNSLFHMRLIGLKKCKGEYVAHLDYCDFISIDFYRSLIYSLQENDGDMAIGDIVKQCTVDNNTVYSFAKAGNFDNNLQGEKIAMNYFSSYGFDYYWNVIWNKVCTKFLWNKIISYCSEFKTEQNITSDLIYSILMFLNTKKIVRVENNYVFRCMSDHFDISNNKLTNSRDNMINEFDDSFSLIENILITDNSAQEKLECFKSFKNNFIEIYKNDTWFLNKLTVSTGIFKNLYEDIKKIICDPKIKVVSFDIFDTLIVRPFLKPTDLFLLLDDDFRRLAGGKTIVDFSTLRIESENRARELLQEKNKKYEDITLDEIYERFYLDYGISKEISERMKQLEVEAEIRFCSVRQSVLELYQMAIYIGKKVVCISDMYLPKVMIERILTQNGYIELLKIYVSSETRLSKWKSLFSYVVSDLRMNSDEILHIGDNYQLDFVKAKKSGLNAYHLIKTHDAFFDPATSGNLGQIFTRMLPFWQANYGALDFFGMRAMISLVSNRYFDNPYRQFNNDSDFNTDPKLIGYGAVGMYLFGIVTWLINILKEKKYDKVFFVARDGYLPMEAYKILKPLYENLPQEEYLYMSRQSVLLLSMQDNLDIYKLNEIIRWEWSTPIGIIPYLRVIFDIDMDMLKILCREEKIDLNSRFKNLSAYHKFVTICRDNFFDKIKYHEKLVKIRSYFDSLLKGNVCIFDIGYSARPELYLSKLCEKPIDTYFIHINCDDGMRNAHKGDFKLTTFFDFRPVIFGYIDELLFSKIEGSCIGYDIDGEIVNPIIGETNLSYSEQFIINNIQKSALFFIHDIANIFKFDIYKLWCQPYHTSLLFWFYNFSSKEIDRNLFKYFKWEDDIAFSTGLLIDKWNQVINWTNQRTLDELYSCRTNLEGHSKTAKFFYWFFFNREFLKVKIKDRFKDHKIILAFFKFSYRSLKNIKHALFQKNV